VNSNFFGARVYFLRLVQRDVHELQTRQSTLKQHAQVSNMLNNAALAGTSSKPRMTPSSRTCIKNGLGHEK
jgi:hypothetical protein